MNGVRRYVIDAVLAALGLLFVNWFIGWWGNAYLKGEFDLHSCWEGVEILGGTGIIALLRFGIDSLANSPRGEHPYQKAEGTPKEGPSGRKAAD